MSKVLEQWGHLGTTEYTCSHCSKTFLVVTCFDKKKPKTGKRFCSKRCWYDYKSANKITWNAGLTKETDARLNYHRPTAVKKGQRLSPKTEFTRERCSGANSPTWKGGVTPKNTLIRQSAEYKAWRKKVFERDDYTCQLCGVRGEKLHADHIKPFASHPELRFELSNGRALCIPCHRATPTFLKRNDLIAA